MNTEEIIGKPENIVLFIISVISSLSQKQPIQHFNINIAKNTSPHILTETKEYFQAINFDHF